MKIIKEVIPRQVIEQREKTSYACEFCGASYFSIEGCEDHELKCKEIKEFMERQPNKFHVGDVVSFVEYGGRRFSVVNSVVKPYPFGMLAWKYRLDMTEKQEDGSETEVYICETELQLVMKEEEYEKRIKQVEEEMSLLLPCCKAKMTECGIGENGNIRIVIEKNLEE